ncbi:hypothetical protein GQX74_011524 [Glossina fuscipes]|nr:hypothetical protein GQX74_011524 [Glossina fuscipes]
MLTATTTTTTTTSNQQPSPSLSIPMTTSNTVVVVGSGGGSSSLAVNMSNGNLLNGAAGQINSSGNGVDLPLSHGPIVPTTTFVGVSQYQASYSTTGIGPPATLTSNLLGFMGGIGIASSQAAAAVAVAANNAGNAATGFHNNNNNNNNDNNNNMDNTSEDSNPVTIYSVITFGDLQTMIIINLKFHICLEFMELKEFGSIHVSGFAFDKANNNKNLKSN